ncbi:uncharacterized protein [Fopius arisanus]|uniref:Uncharacterized protein n=2 Tax=Fopius arisanus TaxID=64838 RepID=A0A9R1U1B6_9HYME|nr:PREDICTED: uncharacterized protein LOC105266870 [Fopius arisanus]
MKILLLIGVIVLPYTLGQNMKCYDGVECKPPCNAVIKKEVLCSSQCLKIDFEMSDKSVATAHKCGLPYLGGQGPAWSLFNLTSYAPGTKVIPEITAGHVYLCKKNLCNGAHSIIPASLLLTFVITIASLFGASQTAF